MVIKTAGVKRGYFNRKRSSIKRATKSKTSCWSQPCCCQKWVLGLLTTPAVEPRPPATYQITKLIHIAMKVPETLSRKPKTPEPAVGVIPIATLAQQVSKTAIINGKLQQ